MRWHRQHRSKELCDSLAKNLARRDVFETVRWIQALGPERGRPVASSPRRNSSGAQILPILGFEPQHQADGKLRFVSTDGRILDPEHPNTLRICLLGESAAAGYFYPPEVTAAKILEHVLDSGGKSQYDVVDLALPGQTLEELFETAAASRQLAPDLVIVFSGNNWFWSALGPDLCIDADPRCLAELRDCAEFLAAYGVAGLKRRVEERIGEMAREAMARIHEIIRASDVKMMVVIPEVNLADIAIRQPIYWHGDGDIAAWYADSERIEAMLAEQTPEAAEAAELIARRLIERDGGACGVSQFLLARTLLRQGRFDEASAALRAQVDATCWDTRFRRASAAGTAVVRELEDFCRRWRVPRVDLRRLFAQQTGSPLAGRRLFLDHCHLTPEGMRIAMAGVAAMIPTALNPACAPGDVDSLLLRARSFEVPTGVDALARLHAGFHNLNLSNGNTSLVSDLFTSAIRDLPELRNLLKDYVIARCACVPAGMTSAARRSAAAPLSLDSKVWEQKTGHLDVVVQILAAVHEGFPELETEMVQALVDLSSWDQVELTDAEFVGLQGYDPQYADPGRPTFYRAFSAISDFYLIFDGDDQLQLDLTVRRPRSMASGDIVVSADDHQIATISVGSQWHREVMQIDAGTLRSGIHRVQVEWPPISQEPEALQRAVDRLRLGWKADLYPIFGEILSLTVQRQRSFAWARKSTVLSGSGRRV